MENRHGDFIWYELMTTDADAAERFYGGLLEWRFARSDNAGMDYRIFSTATSQVGGLMALTPDMQQAGARPAWLGYIGVDDVDRSIAAMTAAGAKLLMPAWDIPGVGRLAMVSDPQGAPFYVMKPVPEPDDSQAVSKSFAAETPLLGHCAWNELASADPEAAKAFYGSLFHWAQDGEMDMGPLGKYQFWKVGDARGHMLGAVMPLMPGMPVSAWTFYLRIADIDAAHEYVTTNGGNIVQEPMEIPGGDYSLVAMDPQGATFGLVGPRN